MIVMIVNLKNMIKLFNIGFTQKNAEEFFGILKRNKINCLVDIRLNPNGQLSRFAFEKDLPYFLDKLVDGCKYGVAQQAEGNLFVLVIGAAVQLVDACTKHAVMYLLHDGCIVVQRHWFG